MFRKQTGNIFSYSSSRMHPHIQEIILKRIYGIACQSEMGVTPILEIVVIDVHSSGVCNLPVYDHYFPVIPIIDVGNNPMKPGISPDFHTG